MEAAWSNTLQAARGSSDCTGLHRLVSILFLGYVVVMIMSTDTYEAHIFRMYGSDIAVCACGNYNRWVNNSLDPRPAGWVWGPAD